LSSVNYTATERSLVENYEVGIVLTALPGESKVGGAGMEAESKGLNLRFWLVLTNQREVFPQLTLENKYGMALRAAGHMRLPSAGNHQLCLFVMCRRKFRFYFICISSYFYF
jgi:hypothetical protein